MFLFLVIMFLISMFGVDYGVNCWPEHLHLPQCLAWSAGYSGLGLLCFRWSWIPRRPACVNINISILDIILLTRCSGIQIGSMFECRASAAECGCVHLWHGSWAMCWKRGVMFTPWQHRTSPKRPDEDCCHLLHPVAPPPPHSSMTFFKQVNLCEHTNQKQP